MYKNTPPPLVTAQGGGPRRAPRPATPAGCAQRQHLPRQAPKATQLSSSTTGVLFLNSLNTLLRMPAAAPDGVRGRQGGGRGSTLRWHRGKGPIAAQQTSEPAASRPAGPGVRPYFAQRRGIGVAQLTEEQFQALVGFFFCSADQEMDSLLPLPSPLRN